jgi:hypothetical protein
LKYFLEGWYSSVSDRFIRWKINTYKNYLEQERILTPSSTQSFIRLARTDTHIFGSNRIILYLDNQIPTSFILIVLLWQNV